jgi:hypothetical protein
VIAQKDKANVPINHSAQINQFLTAYAIKLEILNAQKDHSFAMMEYAERMLINVQIIEHAQ